MLKTITQRIIVAKDFSPVAGLDFSYVY